MHNSFEIINNYYELSSIIFFSTFDDYKKLQDLLDVTDSFTTLPNASMRETFDQSIQAAQDSISGVFFDDNASSCELGDKPYSALRNELASYLMTKSISKVRKTLTYTITVFTLYILMCGEIINQLFCFNMRDKRLQECR